MQILQSKSCYTHKGIIVLLWWLLAANTVFAQNDTLPIINPVNEWFIKLSPLAALEIDGGIGFSGECVIPKKRLGIQLELQPVFFNPYQNKGGNLMEKPDGLQSSGMPLGIKLRPEVRYYLNGLYAKPYYPHIITKADGTQLRRPARSRAYVAVDFLFKQVWTQRLGDVRITNGGTQQAYLQRATYTDIKQVLGFNVKLGSVISLSGSNRWFLEPFAGLGIRFKKFRYRNLPVGAIEPERSTIGIPTDITNETGTWHTGMSLPAGIKLVYRLKKTL